MSVSAENTASGAVAKFFVEAGVQIDIFKAKFAGPRLGLDIVIDEGPIKTGLEWMSRLAGTYERSKELLREFGRINREDVRKELTKN